MKTKKYWTWVFVSVGFLLVIAVYQAGKFARENSEELAFQKEKEATRKAEFAKLQRIYEEEKQAEEIRRAEERQKEALKMLMESRDALNRMLLEGLTKLAEEKRRREEKSEEREKEAVKMLMESWAAMSTKDSPVSAPTTKAQGGKTYINVGGGHWVSKNIDHGKYIKLEDRSLWEVSPIDKIECSLWLPTSVITVVESQNPLYPYFLINTDDGEKVEAKLISD